MIHTPTVNSADRHPNTVIGAKDTFRMREEGYAAERGRPRSGFNSPFDKLTARQLSFHVDFLRIGTLSMPRQRQAMKINFPPPDFTTAISTNGGHA
jgi:hypothetical protein